MELNQKINDIGNMEQSWKKQPASSIYCRDQPLKELRKSAGTMGNDWSIMQHILLAKRASDEQLIRKNYPAYLKNIKLK